MADLRLVADYSASANDSTSCTTAFSNAGTDLAADYGGTILFDGPGIYRLTGKTEIQPYGDVRIKGNGDSAARFMAQSDRHISISAQQRGTFFDGFTGIGQASGNSSTSEPTIYNGGGGVSQWFNTQIIGVAATNAVAHFQNVQAALDTCNFSGCAAGVGVVRFYQWRSAALKNCQFADYATYAAVLYSKTPGGSNAWVYLSNPLTPQDDATDSNNLLIENCLFDEGAAYPVYMVGGPSAKIVGCTVNVGGSQGFHIEGVETVAIENTWVGYSTSGSKKGLTLKDCGYVRLEGLTLAQDVDYIEISGTTRQVDIIGGDLNVGNNVTYPTSIYNPAGAEVRINGIRQVNGLTQIG